MAIYSRPMGVDAFKGSSGGVTFQVAGSSSSVRQRRVPRNYRTPKSSASRNAFTHVRSNWRTLNMGQKTTWTAESHNYPRVNSLGQVYTLDSTNLFTRLNKVHVEGGFVINKNAVAPTPFASPSIVSVAVEVSPVDILFQLSPINVPANRTYIVSASAPLLSSPSVPTNTTVYESYKMLTGTSSAVNSGSGFLAKFGDNANYNGMFVVLTLDQVSNLSGDKRRLYTVVVEIGA